MLFTQEENYETASRHDEDSFLRIMIMFMIISDFNMSRRSLSRSRVNSSGYSVTRSKSNDSNQERSLTSGAMTQICQEEDITDPILQVLGHKPIKGSDHKRY